MSLILGRIVIILAGGIVGGVIGIAACDFVFRLRDHAHRSAWELWRDRRFYR